MSQILKALLLICLVPFAPVASSTADKPDEDKQFPVIVPAGPVVGPPVVEPVPVMPAPVIAPPVVIPGPPPPIVPVVIADEEKATPVTIDEPADLAATKSDTEVQADEEAAWAANNGFKSFALRSQDVDEAEHSGLAELGSDEEDEGKEEENQDEGGNEEEDEEHNDEEEDEEHDDDEEGDDEEGAELEEDDDEADDEEEDQEEDEEGDEEAGDGEAKEGTDENSAETSLLQAKDDLDTSMQAYDADKDGKLSLAELVKALEESKDEEKPTPEALGTAFVAADADKDDLLCNEELEKLADIIDQPSPQSDGTALIEEDTKEEGEDEEEGDEEDDEENEEEDGKGEDEEEDSEDALTDDDLNELLAAYDTDKDGKLSLAELQKGVEESGDEEKPPAGELVKTFEMADSNKDNLLDRDELLKLSKL